MSCFLSEGGLASSRIACTSQVHRKRGVSSGKRGLEVILCLIIIVLAFRVVQWWTVLTIYFYLFRMRILVCCLQMLKQTIPELSYNRFWTLTHSFRTLKIHLTMFRGNLTGAILLLDLCLLDQLYFCIKPHKTVKSGLTRLMFCQLFITNFHVITAYYICTGDVSFYRAEYFMWMQTCNV